ncbi:hypothetical protein ACQP1V_42935 (plasmid) [Microtetraspora malaysiensis]|uniref:hypothetical protein n=1 Tax=Microtetraspora malaysiensis TaxID=161358 RepID=UPI003D937B8B
MDTMTRLTRAELLQGVAEVRDAGGTATHMLHTIARMTAGPAGTDFEHHLANVLDTASSYFDDLSSQHERNTGSTPYPPEASFDDLVGDDQTTVIGHVVNEFGELDQPDEPPAPIALADHLLDGVRKAAALRTEYGDTFTGVYSRARMALFALLRTQSVSADLATESINHALESGKGIAEAVAYMDGQL